MTKGGRERLRAELAGKVMASLVLENLRNGPFEGYRPIASLAESSVVAADALLAELERTAEDPIKAVGTE